MIKLNTNPMKILKQMMLVMNMSLPMKMEMESLILKLELIYQAMKEEV